MDILAFAVEIEIVSISLNKSTQYVLHTDPSHNWVRSPMLNSQRNRQAKEKNSNPPQWEEEEEDKFKWEKKFEKKLDKKKTFDTEKTNPKQRKKINRKIDL